ncbi:ABC transporter ATP-binding protein [Desulfovibrio psychrotolerans]|uniref:ABC transporter ATP-binding protein n=2 Tax=Desulfovibrio psychrotolerans TaxID=415242 RepID=A0A7J0BQR1_9BACT|nr:ABC transporter ATP-binding protein [Desulfovibrio psychrotolerans]
MSTIIGPEDASPGAVLRDDGAALLTVDELCVDYVGGRVPQKLIEGISFPLRQGECLGILGESGSGKSITCKALMGLLDNDFLVRGAVRLKGEGLPLQDERVMRPKRGRQIAIIMQNPLSAFNPLFTIGEQLEETFRTHLGGSVRAGVLAADTLDRMLIKEPQRVLRCFPYQLSGGMLQRVMIGLTLALQPALILADEPTTALDSVTQHEVMREFVRLRQQSNGAMIFVSHDLGALRMVADAVLVMCQGRAVEYGPAETVFNNPRHEHTRYLIETRRELTGRFARLVGAAGAGHALACVSEDAHVAG